jgi:DNA-binding response OmpR family regulator
VVEDSFDQKPLALIIEDDRKLAAIFAQAINRAGFEAEIIRQGQVALARLAESSPQLVLLDLHLPSGSGQEILSYIRLKPHLARTKVIIGTADPLLAESLQGDPDLILIKPISFTQLRDLAMRLNLPSAG